MTDSLLILFVNTSGFHWLTQH